MNLCEMLTFSGHFARKWYVNLYLHIALPVVAESSQYLRIINQRSLTLFSLKVKDIQNVPNLENQKVLIN